MTTSGDTVAAPERAARHGRASTARWAVAGGLCAAFVVALSALQPVLPLALVGGVGILLLAAFKPKAFAVVALLIIILSVPIKNTLGPVGNYADEAMVVLATGAFATRRLVTSGRLVWLPGAFWFVGFVALGVASSVVNSVPLGTWGPGGFIAVKSALFAFALAQLEWTTEDLRRSVRLGVAAILLLAFTGALNLIAPGPWARLTTGNPPIGAVGGIPALNGPFQHPAAFSRLNAVLAIAVLVYAFTVRRSGRNVILLLIAAGLAFLTFEVKSIVALIVSGGLLATRFARPVGIAALIGVGPLLIGLVAPSLGSLIGSDVQLYVFGDSARYNLAVGSVLVANRYFPLGAGFGRYGSATAAADYSPEYYRLGFDSIFGLGPADKGAFLNDNQWPAIIGETGYLGAALLAIGFVAAASSLVRRISLDEEPLMRWIRISGIGWIVVLLIESLAAPVFVSAPSYPFLFGAVGVVASLRHAAKHPPGGQPRSQPDATSSDTLSGGVPQPS